MSIEIEALIVFRCSSEWTDQSSVASSSHLSSTSLTSLPLQRLQALSTLNQAFIHRRMDTNDSIDQSILSVNMGETDDGASSCLSISDVNDFAASSFRSLLQDEVSTPDQASTSDMTDFSSGSQVVLCYYGLVTF